MGEPRSEREVMFRAPHLRICSWKLGLDRWQDLWLLTAIQRHRGALVGSCMGADAGASGVSVGTVCCSDLQGHGPRSCP